MAARFGRWKTHKSSQIIVRVIWTDTALDDIDAIHGYLARFNPSAAAQVVNALVEAADNLKVFPAKGRTGLIPGTREFTIVVPYVLVYRIRSDVIDIVRILHAKRNRNTLTDNG